MLSKTNLYDRLLFLLIVSLAFGNFGGILFAPAHILSYFYIPFIWSTNKRQTKEIKTVLIIMVVMFAYAAISLLWTPDISRARDNLVRLAIHVLIFYEMFIISQKAKKPIDILVSGWICLFALTAVVGIWEIITDSHLSNAREVSEFRNEALLIEKHTAAVTFYNSNTYSMFVVMAFPFILYRLSSTKKITKLLIIIGLILAMVYILFMNASRGSLISVAIMFLLYVWFNFGFSKKRNNFFLIFVLLMLGLFFYYFGHFFTEAILYRTNSSSLFEDNVRTAIYFISWEEFLSTYGIGRGIGSMQSVLEGYGSGLIQFYYCHNLILELLLEGGVVFGIIFFCYLVKLFNNARKSASVIGKMFAYGVLLAFPFYSIINSQYLPPTFIWCFFASVMIITERLRLDSKEIRGIKLKQK